jgi:hypothetical protein
MPSAFDNVAARLKEAIPKRPDGKEITAWREQAVALNNMATRLTNAENRIAILEGTQPTPGPTPDPPPPPPPTPEKQYAPRAYNTAPNGADARFCMRSEYGVTRHGAGWIDALGVTYDEGGRDLGGRTKLQVPELKPANEMDHRDVCDEYVGPTGVRVGGTHGYPAGSFER